MSSAFPPWPEISYERRDWPAALSDHIWQTSYQGKEYEIIAYLFDDDTDSNMVVRCGESWDDVLVEEDYDTAAQALAAAQDYLATFLERLMEAAL